MSCQQKRVPNHLPRPVLSVAERKEGEEFIFALTITEGEEEELLTPYGLALRDNIGVQGLDKEFVRKVKLIAAGLQLCPLETEAYARFPLLQMIQPWMKFNQERKGHPSSRPNNVQ